MVVRVVVGAPTVVVHLHEVGLGLLVDLRPTDPSFAILAIDRQGLPLDEEAPKKFLAGGRGGWSCQYRAFFPKSLLLLLWEMEGVVVIVIHSLPLVLGDGSEGGHGHA